MSVILKVLAATNQTLARAGLWLSMLGLVAMSVIIGWQIWGRYVLNDTPDWSERLSLFLMNYYILLAAAVGVRERFHIGLVFIKESLPAAPRRATEVVIHLLIATFGASMAWYGGQMSVATWSHDIPTLGVPTGAGYLPFPIAGVLIIAFSAEHILRALAGTAEAAP